MRSHSCCGQGCVLPVLHLDDTGIVLLCACKREHRPTRAERKDSDADLARKCLKEIHGKSSETLSHKRETDGDERLDEKCEHRAGAVTDTIETDGTFLGYQIGATSRPWVEHDSKPVIGGRDDIFFLSNLTCNCRFLSIHFDVRAEPSTVQVNPWVNQG